MAQSIHWTFKNPREKGRKAAPQNDGATPAGAPRKIKTRDDLINALSEVAALEHALLCSYLYAEATLKQAPEEFDNNYKEWETVREWRRSLLKVAREEMQHLHLANALLTAIGGPPVFRTPNFPTDSFWFGDESESGVNLLTVPLAPLNIDTLRLFIRFEASEPWLEADSGLRHCVKQQIRNDLLLEQALKYVPLPVPYEGQSPFEYRKTLRERILATSSSKENPLKMVEGYLNVEEKGTEDDEIFGTAAYAVGKKEYETIGELYSAIKEGFETIPGIITSTAKQDGSGDIEVGAGIRSINKGFHTSIDSVGTALRVIDAIVAEGEGATTFVNDMSLEEYANGEGLPLPPTFDQQAHLYRFLKMYVQYADLLKSNPSFTPHRSCISNPVAEPHNDTWQCMVTTSGDNGADPTKCHLMNSPMQKQLLSTFSKTYQVMLTWLQQLYLHNGSKEEREAINGLIFMAYMSQIIRPFMEILSEIDAGVGYENYKLGPTFECNSWHGLIPRTPHQLQLDRMKDIVTSLNEICENFCDEIASETLQRLEVLSKNMENLRKDFITRTQHGYSSSYDPSVQRFSIYPGAAPDDAYEEAGENCVFSSGLLKLEFSGWYITRLATDPDPADEKWGASGNSFSFAGEPPLNRQIYFGVPPAESEIERTHNPNGPFGNEIGVKVRGVKVLKPKYPQRQIYVSDEETVDESAYETVEDMSQTLTDELVNNYYVELLKDGDRPPVFEGQNHIVAPDGEPIDPFIICVRNNPQDNDDDLSTTIFKRSCRGPPIEDMEPTQKSFTGRFPKALKVDFAKTAKMTTISLNPWRYFMNRVDDLRVDLQKVDDCSSTSNNYWKIRRRIDDLFLALSFAGYVYDVEIHAKNKETGKDHLETIAIASEALALTIEEKSQVVLQSACNEAVDIVNAWVDLISVKDIRDQLLSACRTLSDSGTWTQLTDCRTKVKTSNTFKNQQKFSEQLEVINKAAANLEIISNPSDIRTTRLGFYASQIHSVSGPYEAGEQLATVIENNPSYTDGKTLTVSTGFGDSEPEKGTQGGDNTRWLCQYEFGWFDTDTCAAYTNGNLYIPITVNEPDV